MKKKLLIPGIVLGALLMIGVGVIGAALLTSKSATTGAFTVSVDGAATIETYKVNGDGTLTLDNTPTWCAAPNLAFNVPVYCAIKVTNNTGANMFIDMTTTGILNADGKALASKITMQGKQVAAGLNCTDPNTIGSNPSAGLLSAAPAFTGAQVAAGGSTTFCFRLRYDQTPNNLFGATTGATFNISTRDQ